jgi:hypothetical protein
MCIMGCGKKKFKNTPLVNNPVLLTVINLISLQICIINTYLINCVSVFNLRAQHKRRYSTLNDIIYYNKQYL